MNFIATIAKRRERPIYVAIGFYVATVITVAILHIFNNLALPVSLFKSYSIYGGVQGSLAYNVIGIALAVSGRLDLLWAAITMPLSSITVVTAALGARTFTRSSRT